MKDPSRFYSCLFLFFHSLWSFFWFFFFFSGLGVSLCVSKVVIWLFEVRAQTYPDVKLRDVEAGVGWASWNKTSIIFPPPHHPPAAENRSLDSMGSVVAAWYHSLSVRTYQVGPRQWAHCCFNGHQGHMVFWGNQTHRDPLFLSGEIVWLYPKLPT